jgi:hypothetical protein
MMPAGNLVADLIRAANQIDTLTDCECLELLVRAAGLISDYGRLLNFTPTSSLGSGNIASDLYAMAYSVELLGTGMASDAMLEAAKVISALRIRLREA